MKIDTVQKAEEILSEFDQETVDRLSKELSEKMLDNDKFVDWLVVNAIELVWENEPSPRQSRIVAVCDAIKTKADGFPSSTMQGQVSKSLDKISNVNDTDSPYFHFCTKKRGEYYRYDRKQYRENLEEEFVASVHFKKDHPAIFYPSTVIIEIDGKEVERAEELIRNYYYDTEIYDIFYTNSYLVVIFDREGGLVTLGEDKVNIRNCKKSIIEFAELVRDVYEQQNGTQKKNKISPFRKTVK